jgi:thiamine biosynthesis lipoprotein
VNENGKNQIEFEAIGTHWWIEIFDDIPTEKCNKTFSKIRLMTKQFEDNYSRFKEGSYIVALNNNRELDNFPEELYEILKYAEEMRQVSHGYFDITIGTVLENYGYDKDYSFTTKKKLTSYNHFLVVEKEKITIDENVKIDLGGIGKGWLIEKIRQFLLNEKIKYFSINGGGDIFASSNIEEPLEFFLENPFNSQEAIGKIYIKDKGIACSSFNRRKWIDSNTGQNIHHLIDPKTAKPINDIAAVFTYSENALIADIMSTLIYVTPLELSLNIAKKYNTEYLIIFPGGEFFKSEGYPGILNQ